MYKIMSNLWFLIGAICYLLAMFFKPDREIELLLTSACDVLFAIWFRLLSKEDKNE